MAQEATTSSTWVLSVQSDQRIHVVGAPWVGTDTFCKRFVIDLPGRLRYVLTEETLSEHDISVSLTWWAIATPARHLGAETEKIW